MRQDVRGENDGNKMKNQILIKTNSEGRVMMINGGVFQLSVIMVIMWFSLCMPEILGYIYHYAKNGVSTTIFEFFTKYITALPPFHLVSFQKFIQWWATYL